MLPVCILHGLNNTGKSNILSAIDTVFRRKLIVEDTTFTELTTVDDVTKFEQVTKQLERAGSFWQGRIVGFRDNFYRNSKNDITFSVSVCFTDDELAFLKGGLEHLTRGGHNNILTLTGRIKYVDDASGDMVLERAAFNGPCVVFEVDGDGKRSFFPKEKGLGAEERLGYFDELMNLLADAFALLPADRYLTSEHMVQESTGGLPLTSKTFKQWLFNLSLSRSGHTAFDQIKTMFASKPFDFGEIGFSKERDEIEIMVKEKDNVWLPIDRVGSGHQQTLYIIANLVLNKKKMMGIEELEINLSPTAQKNLFEKLKHHIYKGTDLISQIIITSHSDYFGGRGDVRCYNVKHDGLETTVEPWSKAIGKKFFSPSDGWRQD
jgi:hypothetical protein